MYAADSTLCFVFECKSFISHLSKMCGDVMDTTRVKRRLSLELRSAHPASGDTPPLLTLPLSEKQRLLAKVGDSVHTINNVSHPSLYPFQAHHVTNLIQVGSYDDMCAQVRKGRLTLTSSIPGFGITHILGHRICQEVSPSHETNTLSNVGSRLVTQMETDRFGGTPLTLIAIRSLRHFDLAQRGTNACRQVSSALFLLKRYISLTSLNQSQKVQELRILRSLRYHFNVVVVGCSWAKLDHITTAFAIHSTPDCTMSEVQTYPPIDTICRHIMRYRLYAIFLVLWDGAILSL